MDLQKSESRILIIDDEESLRLTFKTFLSREGYGPIDAVATFEEAAEILRKKTFDLVISDIVLEGASGIDLLRQVKDAGLKCPVVMVTGYPNINSASEAVRLGAFDYLSKPVKKDDLLRVARMALQQYGLWREKEKLEEEKDIYRQHLEAIFRSVRDFIVTVDTQMRLVDMNNRAKKRFQKIMPNIAIGDLITDLPGPLGQIFFADADEVLRSRHEVQEHQVEFDLSGEQSIFRISAVPLEARNGSFEGVVLVAHDVSRLEQLEKMGKRTLFHRIIGGSRAMQPVYTMIENVGHVDTSVLITGESGTGKELVAEALHAESPRRDMPLIKVDCTAISETLLESELFGHKKGSFTGADRDRKGRILHADGGTLFLDEIGDISPMMQLRLLRFLQERTFYPVGQDHPIKVDVRVIAATNADLKQRVNSGDFREDLYFRLRVVDIPLPPLRDRDGDLELLVKSFLKRFSKRLDKQITGVSDQALHILSSYNWPGNVRELENVMERATVLCHGPTITTEHISEEIVSYCATPGNGAISSGKISSEPMPFLENIESDSETELERIISTLKIVDGNKAKAARLLGIDRSTLYRKLRHYDLDPINMN
ncbi:MAG: sigma 54-interacting transcriptional regulator [Proteobacteria bacterium]|nr:sigma 54-interacting transcriptional regulator [Pseudomonadota bacterium]MBU1710769.1 sigma 54-interacting transcriptional regulator [Pseudomonadota bacterium]